MKKIIILAMPAFLMVYLLFSTGIFKPHIAYGAGNEINISTNADTQGYLINVDNLKPGDWIPRELTIKNDGTENFTYRTVVLNTGTAKNLFNELEFWIKSGNTFLYNGLLKDFTGLPTRFLTSGASEKLLFQVKMPYELGNEFMGAVADLTIQLVAEGGSDGNPPVNPPVNPPPVNPPPPVDPPDNPDEPGNPTEPGEPANPDEPGEDNPGFPAPPANPPSSGEPPESGNPAPPTTVTELPETATNIFNMMLFGAWITIAGGAIVMIARRKRIVPNEGN